MTTKGRTFHKAFPCDKCGNSLTNRDEVYDIIFYKRYKTWNRGVRSQSKLTLNHLRLCKECSREFGDFLNIYKKGYFE